MNFIISMVNKHTSTGEKQNFLRILHSEDWTTEDIAFATFSKMLKTNSLKVENAVITKNKLHLINFKDSLPELTINSDGTVASHTTQYILIAKVMSEGVLVGYVLTDSVGEVFTIQQQCVKDLDIQNICNVKKCKGDVFMYSEKDYPSITLDEIPDTDDEEVSDTDDEEVLDTEATEESVEDNKGLSSFNFGEDVAVLDEEDLSDITDDTANLLGDLSAVSEDIEDFSTLDSIGALDDLGDLSSLASFDSSGTEKEIDTAISNIDSDTIEENIANDTSTEINTEEISVSTTMEEVEEDIETEEIIDETKESISEIEDDIVEDLSDTALALNISEFSNGVIQSVTDTLNAEIQQKQASNIKRVVEQFADKASADIADAGYWVALTTTSEDRIIYSVEETEEFFKVIELSDLQLNSNAVNVLIPRTEVNNVLTEIYVPKGIQFNGDYLLCNCVALRYVYFGWDTKELGEGVCFNDTQLTDILFGETGINHIPTAAFAGCKSLTNFDTEGVKTVGNTAFANSGLKSVNFATITDTGALAFAGCEDLTNISNINTSLLVKWKVAAQQYNLRKQSKIDSETVISLHLGVFADCPKLQSLELTDTDKVILQEAVLMFP